MPFSVQLQDRTAPHFLTFWGLAQCVAFVLTWASTLSAFRLAIEHNFAPIFALSPDWEKEFLAPSMACSTMDAFNIVRRLDHDGKLDEAPQKTKQKVAAGLLCDKLHEQDFAGLISLRASKVLGPISRYRVGDILLHETCIACFSSWAHCWRSSNPLQRAMHGSKISH